MHRGQTDRLKGEVARIGENRRGDQAAGQQQADASASGPPDRNRRRARAENGKAGNHDRGPQNRENSPGVQAETREPDAGDDHRSRKEGEAPAPERAVGIRLFNDQMTHCGTPGLAIGPDFWGISSIKSSQSFCNESHGWRPNFKLSLQCGTSANFAFAKSFMQVRRMQCGNSKADFSATNQTMLI